MKMLLEKSFDILSENRHRSFTEDRFIMETLSNEKSSVRGAYINKLYDSIIDKKYVDFGNIPSSKGDITKYAGYDNIVEVLAIISKIASEEHTNTQNTVREVLDIINKAISNMVSLKDVYEKGFKIRDEYIMLDYNVYVYAIVQAVSSILYEFVDYIKRPDAIAYEIKLKNTKYKANLFYVDNLKSFNEVCKSGKYDKYLQGMLNGGTKNFTGVEVVGLAVIMSIAISIIPVTRELIYQYYNTKSKISDMLAQQAYFLELNKSVVEANTSFTPEKRKDILIKQEKVKNLCLKFSEKLRIENIHSQDTTKESLKRDNKLLTIDNIKREVNDNEFSLL